MSMNKMQCISIAFIDVNSVKFAYGVGIEERIYIDFAKTQRFNKSDILTTGISLSKNDYECSS